MANGANYIQNQKLQIFNVVLLDHFHMVDSDRVSKEGKPYQDFADCTGKQCKLCNSGAKRVFGKRMYWPLGPMHGDQLADIAKKTLSRNCACGGKIRPIAFECPRCRTTYRDLEDNPFDNKKELAKFRAEDHTCGNHKCGYHGPMVEIPFCNNCKKAVPLNLFNTQLEVYMSGTGTKSTLMVPEYTPLSVELKAKIKDALIPFDFNKVWDYKPLSPEEQAKWMGIDNPYSQYVGNLEDGEDDESGSSAWGYDDSDSDSDSDNDELDIEI
jgi:hypothetical protein